MDEENMVIIACAVCFAIGILYTCLIISISGEVISEKALDEACKKMYGPDVMYDLSDWGDDIVCVMNETIPEPVPVERVSCEGCP